MRVQLTKEYLERTARSYQCPPVRIQILPPGTYKTGSNQGTLVHFTEEEMTGITNTVRHIAKEVLA